MRRCENNPDLLNTQLALPADYSAMGTAAQLFTKSLLMGADHAMDKSEYSSFDIEALPFEAAIKYMTKKMPMSAEEYYKLSDKERFRAFTVGRIADGTILEKVKKALTDNMREKTGFGTFLKQTDKEILDSAGMGTGKSWYWETVYRTNIQTSYNMGRALGFEATQPLALEFVGLEDDRQTDICRKLSEARIIRPYGDPFWDTHTPPLHFNCRSTLRAIYDKEELPEDYTPIKNAKAYAPAKGFGAAPTKGDSWWEELASMKAQAERYGVQKEIEAAREKLVTPVKFIKLDIEEFKKIRQPITSEERKIVYGHSHFSGYINSHLARKINNLIRTNKPLNAEYTLIRNTLQSIINRNTLPENLELTRYVRTDALESMFGVKFPVATLKTTAKEYWDAFNDLPKKLKPGTMYTEKAFLSTSGVSDKNVMTDKGIQINIKAPAGVHAYVTTNYKESEIIFGQGTQLRLIAARTEGSITVDCKLIIDCEIVR